MQMPLLVWLVDDTEHHHQVADATVAALPDVELEHFHVGAASVETYRHRLAAEGGRLPDVVLMDYFLAGERGDQVTQALRQAEDRRHRPVIVGYSSVPSGSQAIVQAGGDVVVRKVSSGAINPHLLDYLRSFLKTWKRT